MATARPILACGGSFDIRVTNKQARTSRMDGVSTVQTEIISSDPHHAAQEIGKRLYVR